MSTNRSDYRATYVRFRAFIECRAQQTTARIGAGGVLTQSSNKPCYTREGEDLVLCASCAEFWRECAEHDDQTTWQMAVFLRETRLDDERF